MTGREWKPGDVAIVTLDGIEKVAIRGAGLFHRRWYVGGPHRGSQHGWYDADVTNARPLVVIDPEDREQVERLWVVLRDGRALQSRDNLTAALREFADPKPPRPDEPQGLGAVIEDTQEELWVRAGTDPDDDQPWHNEDEGWLGWSDIDVAHVLSEGWSE